MSKNILGIVVGVTVLAAIPIVLLFVFGDTFSKEKSEPAGHEKATETDAIAPVFENIINATYTLLDYYTLRTGEEKNASYTLKDGKYYESTGPGASEFVDIRLNTFSPVQNSDGWHAVWLTVRSGGSGVFIYIAIVRRDENGKIVGGRAVFVGDRIKPRFAVLEGDRIQVHYYGRTDEEGFAKVPTIAKEESIPVSKFF